MLKDQEFPESIVAFIDILGFSNLVERISESDSFEAILEPLKLIQNEVDRINKEETYFSNFQLLAVSDCIIISVPLSNQIATIGTLKLIRLFQFGLLSNYGLTIRGYISKGRHYQNNNIIFGPAYINAYRNEQKLHFPYVVVDPLIIKEANEAIKSMPYGYKTIFDELKCEKGIYFVDYLNPKWLDLALPKEDLNREVKRIQQLVQNRLIEYRSNLKIVKKYQWLEKYIQDSLHYFDL